MSAAAARDDNQHIEQPESDKSTVTVVHEQAQPGQSTAPLTPPAAAVDTGVHQPGRVRVIRRNGKVTHFDPNKINVAMTNAFLAVEGGGGAASSRIHDQVERLTEQWRARSPAACPAAAPCTSKTFRIRWSWR